MNRASKLAPLLLLTCGIAHAATAPATAFGIIDQMGAGWNLGNTLESLCQGKGLGTETCWGNPKTTQAMVDFVKKTGFRTIRIPTSWDDHLSGGEFTIDNAWMNRVEEVVNYGLNADMYVILNLHHNYGWENTTLANENAAKNQLQKIWSQIAARFQKYDNHLIFEVMNEPRATVNGSDDWWGTADNMGVLNRLDAAALATIRGTGGNNAGRLVMLPTYVAGANDQQLNAFVLPSGDKMLAVSTHAYFPFNFSMENPGTSTFAGASVDDVFKRLKAKFVDKGIPVVMGEWGSDNKNNLAERVKHAGYYAKAAKASRIPCIVWDNNNNQAWSSTASDNMALFNRAGLSWYYPSIAQAIVDNYGIPTSVGRASARSGVRAFADAAGISFESLDGIRRIELRNAGGRIVAEVSPSGTMARIALRSPGIVLASLEREDGSVERIRIVRP